MSCSFDYNFEYTTNGNSNFTKPSVGKETTKLLKEVNRKIALSPLLVSDILVNKSTIRQLNLQYSPIIKETNLPTNVRADSLHLIVDPTESYEWKKKLIEEAKYSLEIAGYCGGRVFKEFLEIIETKLQSNRELKVRILTNFNMINQEERDLFKRLHATYPNSFQVVTTKATWSLCPTLRRHENHTKMIIADQKYFVSGGTGISNQLLEQGTVEREGGKCAFLCDGNRDLDFLGEGEIASTMKQQFDLLWEKWKIIRGKPFIEALDRGKDLSNTSLEERIQIDLPANSARQMSCELIFSHPEEKINSGRAAYLKFINEATGNIYISNMVFNDKKIIAALAAALRRGVHVIVITNGDLETSPNAAKTLGPRHRLHYQTLFEATAGAVGTLRIYEYKENNILLHSKAMVVDHGIINKVIIGSYNLSKESAKCDDEQIIVVESDVLADETMMRFDFFIENSQEVSRGDLSSISFDLSRLKGVALNALLNNVLN